MNISTPQWMEALEPRCLLSASTATASPPESRDTAEPLAVTINRRQQRRRAKLRNAAVKLIIKDASVTEGDPGQVRQMTFRVIRKGTLTGSTTVNFAAAKLFVDGVRTGTPNVDFNAKSGKVSFAPGEKSKTVQIGVIGDNINENNEQFRVSLSKPKGAFIQRGAAIGTILDNDAGKTVDVSITNDNFTPDENAAYPPTLLPVTLTYTNTGNADSGVTAVQFQLLVFNNGSLDGTADIGPFILVPNVPAGQSISVDYVLDFNRAFIFNDRWDVYAKVLIEDDSPINNLRRLGDIQITLPT